MQLNASRIKVLEAQDEVVKEMKDATMKEVHEQVSGKKTAYKGLLKALIIQSLVRLKESSVLLRCREMDASLVSSVLEDAKREYAKRAGIPLPTITIVVDKIHLPPPPPNSHSHNKDSLPPSPSPSPSWYANAKACINASCIYVYVYATI